MAKLNAICFTPNVYIYRGALQRVGNKHSSDYYNYKGSKKVDVFGRMKVV